MRPVDLATVAVLLAAPNSLHAEFTVPAEVTVCFKPEPHSCAALNLEKIYAARMSVRVQAYYFISA